MFDFNNPVLWYITIGFAVLWVVFTIAERFLIKKRGVDPKKPIEKDYIKLISIIQPKM